ncbi:MAG: Rieske 2Fe-2S domain-containing protein [Conexivisphaerales archaeon]
MYTTKYLASFDISALKESEPNLVNINGEEVCLVKVSGRWFAFDNICTHIGGRLSKGQILPSRKVVCPEHKAVYSIEDGSSFSFPRRGLTVYPVEEKDGKIMVCEPLPPKWRAPLPKFAPGWWRSRTEDII